MKKSKEDEQTLKELNSAHRCSQAKCQLVQASYIKRIKLFSFLPYNKHLINRTKAIVYTDDRLSSVKSVVCTDLTAFGLYLRPSVKILPYKLPVGLIRAK